MIALNADPLEGVPLPISRIRAIHKAAELKRKGWSWPAIARVMGEYHGHWLGAGSWRMSCISVGLDFPKREMTPAKQVVLVGIQARNRVADEERRLARKLPVDGVAV